MKKLLSILICMSMLLSLAYIPVSAAEEGAFVPGTVLFYDDFTEERDDYRFNTSFIPNTWGSPVLTVANGKLNVGKGETSPNANYWGFELPSSAVPLPVGATGREKYVIEFQFSSSWGYNNIRPYVGGKQLFYTPGIGTGAVYYALVDGLAGTATGYYPSSGVLTAGTTQQIGSIADGLGVGFSCYNNGSNNSAFDYIKIYAVTDVDAELQYENVGGAEPDSVNILFNGELALPDGDSLANYITVDGQPVSGAVQDAENPLLYTVQFGDAFDFNSEHTLSITGAPCMMNRTFSKELPFKVRDRAVLTNITLQSGSLAAGEQKIAVDLTNETDLTGNISLIAAVYSADGEMKAFDEITLSSATDMYEFDFTVPTVEEGDTMELYAASSLGSLDIIGTKTVYTEHRVSFEKPPIPEEAVESTATPVCNSVGLTETVTVNLPEGASDRYVSLAVLKEDIDTLETKSDVYYLATKKSENGAAVFNIKMADKKATHSYIWYSQGEEPNTGSSFNFYPESFMNEGLAKINGASKAEIKGYMNTYAEALGIVVPKESEDVLDYAYYALAGLRDEAYPKDGFPNPDEAKETFDTAMFIALKGENTGKFIEEFNTKYGFDPDVYEVYTDAISDSAASAVQSEIADGEAYTLEEVRDLFNERVVLDGNKNAENYSQTKKIIEELCGIIGLDMTVYNNLSAAKQSSVAQALTQKEYADLGKFSDAFDAACASAAESGSTTSNGGYTGGLGFGGGGGGLGFGGGGGSTGSSAASTAGVFSDDIAPNNQDAKKFSSFTDMEGYDWAIDAVEDFYDRGIINGKTADSFAPADNVTRAEISKILALALGLEAAEGDEVKEFGDVTSTHWAFEYINLLSAKGLINGVEEGVFGTDMPLTRQMLVALLHRAAGEPEVTIADDFADMDDADDYAKAAMRYYKSKGAIEGVGKNMFMPQSPITRAEAVVMVSRCLAVE